MDLNATFIGQIIVFLVLLWFFAKFIVPMIAQSTSERQKKIAQGLAAAEQGQKDLELARGNAEQIVREAREHARTIEDQAARRSNETIEQAKQEAQTQGARILAAAAAEAGNEAARTRDALRGEFGALVVQGASRLLGREVDANAHAQLLDELVRDIARG